MRMMYDIIVFENPRFRPSTSKGEVGVLKKLHFGEYFWKAAFTETVFTGYLRTVGRVGEKNISFQTKTDTCGQALNLLLFAVIVDVAVVVA